MKGTPRSSRLTLRLLIVGLVIAALSIATPVRSLAGTVIIIICKVAPQLSSFYSVRNLVSDEPGKAENTDTSLINGWGLAFDPHGYAYVSSTEKGLVEIYDGNGDKHGSINVPGPPTGIVFSTGPDFLVNGAPSRVIVATEEGQIAAWNGVGDAIVKVDYSGLPDHPNYKGLALAANGTARYLYATDFHNTKIDVFDTDFNLVTTLPGNFAYTNAPTGYGPYGIQNILGVLYVTYAKQDADKEDEVTGPGRGFVNVYDANGRYIYRFAAGSPLNAPWGVALAPADFGRFGNTLLIGNFGDGRINSFDVRTGAWLGTLRMSNWYSVYIDGPWGIAFGNGVNGQPTNTLFFAAGPDDEEHGLFGRIDPVAGQSSYYTPTPE